MSKKSHAIGSGNVFKDLGIPNAEEHLVSVERLLRFFLVALNRDVEIVVKPHGGRNNMAALHVS
jgi:hypothetical protein